MYYMPCRKGSGHLASLPGSYWHPYLQEGEPLSMPASLKLLHCPNPNFDPNSRLHQKRVRNLQGGRRCLAAAQSRGVRQLAAF